MHTRLLLVVVLLMGGCAGADSYVYRKPGGTPEERERDKADCPFDARTTVPSPNGPQIRVNQDRYRRCMADRGYTLERVAQ